MPDVILSGSEGNFSAYLATPASGSGAGMILIQEIFGVNKVMRDIANQHAANGYLALCPDLFWRQEPGIQLTDQTDEEWQRAFALYQDFNPDKGVDDLIAALDHLRALDGCSGRVGTVGYCLGGKLAYMMATRSNADCNVSYYGVAIETLLDEAANITRPLLLHIAEEDEFVPKEAQAQIKATLAANPHVTIHSYPGVGHAFARVGGQHFNEEAAALANRRTTEFFKKHLG